MSMFLSISERATIQRAWEMANALLPSCDGLSTSVELRQEHERVSSARAAALRACRDGWRDEDAHEAFRASSLAIRGASWYQLAYSYGAALRAQLSQRGAHWSCVEEMGARLQRADAAYGCAFGRQLAEMHKRDAQLAQGAS